MANLAGRCALVTGGSRGMGAAVAVALARDGADVAFTYRASPDRAASVLAMIEQHGRQGLAIEADSASPEAITRAVTQTVEVLGKIDILVNNAAIGFPGPFAHLELDEFQAMMDVNVRAPVLFAQAVIPHMPSGGRILSVGSALAERVPFAGVTAYAMTKSALLAFTRSLSRELGPEGITVNMLLPGSVDTDMNPATSESGNYQRSLTALGRFGEPQEIADIVAFFVSPAASLITGAIITADGGMNA
ncbi:MAG: SDR family oxidoreductase [Methylobacterium mesophilicum]|nr:SDR family oxidoreductase [Methylobacterium mesophilicum]